MIALMIEAISTSEMSVNFYQTTWCNILNPKKYIKYINELPDQKIIMIG
jgi:hypothetical protein